MPAKPHFLIVSLTDRYDFEWENAAIAAVDEFTAELRSVSSPGPYPDPAPLQGAAAVLITTRNHITDELLSKLPDLKVIGSYGVGLDHIDLDAAAAHGVVITHFPDYCTNEVADHAMSLVLAVNRRIVQLDRDLQTGTWARNPRGTTEILRGPLPALRDTTLGIVGFGRIGRSVARRAAPFGVKLLVSDPYVQPETVEGAELVPFAELLERADIITIHTPLTPETRGMFGSGEFARLKPNAFVVNTARGPILQMAPAAAFAKANPQGGLALDVVDPEPLPLDSPLYGLDNVILTPHAAYYSVRSVEVLREGTMTSVLETLRGQRPRTVANPAVLERVHLAVSAAPLGS